MVAKEKGSLADFKKQYSAFISSEKLAKSLKAEMPAERDSARAGLRKLIQERTPGLDNDTPLHEETYDREASAQLSINKGRAVGYFKHFASDLLEQVPSGALEGKVLSVKPVGLPEDMPNSELHNVAAQIHGSYLALKELNDGVKDKEVNEAYVSQISKIEQGHAAQYLSSKGYSENEIKLLSRTVGSIIRSSPGITKAIGKAFE